MNALVAQMVNFVGEVPTEWQQTWDEIQLASNFAPVKSMSFLKAWSVYPIGLSIWTNKDIWQSLHSCRCKPSLEIGTNVP